MSGAVFLAGVLVISLIGGLVLWIRFRVPRAWDNEMKEFHRTLQALSPESPLTRPRRPAEKQPPRGERAPSG